MDIVLPYRLYPARTVRVQAPDSIEVDLDLGYGTHAHRSLLIAGIDRKVIPAELRDAAYHAAVITLGGKQLLVHTEDFLMNGAFIARVFANFPIKGSVETTLVPGTTERRVEIAHFFKWLTTVDYALEPLKRALNGGLRD